MSTSANLCWVVLLRGSRLTREVQSRSTSSETLDSLLVLVDTQTRGRGSETTEDPGWGWSPPTLDHLPRTGKSLVRNLHRGNGCHHWSLRMEYNKNGGKDNGRRGKGERTKETLVEGLFWGRGFTRVVVTRGTVPTRPDPERTRRYTPPDLPPYSHSPDTPPGGPCSPRTHSPPFAPEETRLFPQDFWEVPSHNPSRCLYSPRRTRGKSCLDPDLLSQGALVGIPCPAPPSVSLPMFLSSWVTFGVVDEPGPLRPGGLGLQRSLFPDPLLWDLSLP